MKQTLIFETLLPCTIETLFDFHADTNNLPLITPEDTSVEILKLETPLKQGNTAVLRIKKGWFSFVWELRFERVEYPGLIVDVATRSPFKSFRHEHHFIKLDETQSILRDVVTFSLPFWPLSALAVWLVKQQMQTMFAYRHQKTKEAMAF
jgi:ligand-binding SRPBCC domain-containing protein